MRMDAQSLEGLRGTTSRSSCEASRVALRGLLPASGKLLAGISVLAATTAFASSAHAQADTAAEGANPEIIVTAQFREQRLQDTPIAITAVTSATLEARSQTSIVEVANQSPSVVLRAQNAISGPSITAAIRGLGQVDFSPSIEPGVGFYIDDVYYPRLTGANFDLLDVERVEVLRGPQGTLTGRNSEGGAIKFFSRRPDGNEGGYLWATYGSRNKIGLRGAADFSLTNNLFGRISGALTNQDGYINQIDYGCSHPGSGVAATQPAGRCEISKLGSQNYQAVKGTLRWQPSDAIDATFTADYINQSQTGTPEVLLYANSSNPVVQPAPGIPLDNRFLCGRFCNYATNATPADPANGFVSMSVSNRTDYEAWGTTANIDFHLSEDVKLTSISSYRKWNTQFGSDADLSPANAASAQSDLHSKTWTQELRLNARLGDLAELTLGGYYSDERINYITLQDQRINGFQFLAIDKANAKSRALFSTAIVRPLDGLTVTGGLRYTKETKDYTYYRYLPDGVTPHPLTDFIGFFYGAGYKGPDTLGLTGNTSNIVEALTGKRAHASDSRLDYRISIDYRFSPEVLAYATVSTGFKGGGVNARPFVPSQAVPFGPETVTAFEVGLKTDLLDRRLRLNVAGFYNKLHGAQLTLTYCPQYGFFLCAVPANAGNADVKGLEAELMFTPIDGLQIDASGSILDWKWKCVDPAVLGQPAGAGSCSSNPADVSRLNSPQQGVAKGQWSIGAQYEVNLGKSGSLTPRIDVNYQGRLPGAVLSPLPGSPSAIYADTPAYTLANAKLTWRNENQDLNISVAVSNLFDKYYFASRTDFTPFGWGVINGVVGRPREWAISVNKKF